MNIEVSIGEVVDKLSILNIKLKNINDPVKLDEIRKEISVLDCANEHISKYPMYYNMMMYVNEQIWNKTDLIKSIDFDLIKTLLSMEDVKEYALISNSIFELNQQRYRIKNFFNILCGSNIKEQKSYAASRCNITVDDEASLYNNLAYINYLTIQYDVITFNCTVDSVLDAIKRIFYAPNIEHNLAECDHVPIMREVNLSALCDDFYLNNVNVDAFEFEPIRYAAGGMFGDFIHSLSIINEMFYKTGRKGLLYISDKHGCNLWRFGIPETYQDTYSVIKSQNYIKDYKMYEDEQIDINLDDWRKNPSLMSVPLYESYNYVYKTEHGVTWGMRPWLNVNKNNEFSNTLIINTVYYRWAANIDFHKLIDEHKAGIKEENRNNEFDVIFLSSKTDTQYKHFIETTGIRIPTVLVNTFQEMCEIIASCKLFAGSASGPLAVATAFDKKRIIGTPNTCDRILSVPFTSNGIEGFN